jgi:hypothetical protein
VKDAYTKTDISRKTFERELPRLCSGEPEECPVELAHEIVYGGIEFAARYGFEPHRDFTAELADQVLDPPETHPRKHKVKFGKKGKPLFVPGPYDDEMRIRSILDTLERTAGKGKYDYIIGIGSPDFLDEDE